MRWRWKCWIEVCLAKINLDDMTMMSSRSLYQTSQVAEPAPFAPNRVNPPPPARPSPMWKRHRPLTTYTTQAWFWVDIRTPVSDMIETSRQ